MDIAGSSAANGRAATDGDDFLTIESYSSSYEMPNSATTQGPPVRTFTATNYPTCPYRALKHPVDRSFLGSCIGCLFAAVFTLILLSPWAVLLLGIIPLVVALRLAFTLPLRCRGELLSDMDLRWLHSTTPVLAHLTLERGLDLGRIRDLVNVRIISAESKHGKRSYPRFTQKLQVFSCGVVWVPDTTFRLDEHVSACPTDVRDAAELRLLLFRLSQETLPSDRPLWHIMVVTDFGPQRDSLLIVRLHPCMTDGVSMVQLLCTALTDEQASFHMHPRFAGANVSYGLIRACILSPLLLLRRWMFLSTDHNLLHPSRPCARPPVKYVHLQSNLPLPRITRVKQIIRCTYNDVFMAVVTGALRAYQQMRGVDNPFDCLVLLAVDMCNEQTEVILGNHYSMNCVKVPVNTEGAIPRLWTVKERMEKFKRGAEWAAMRLAGSLLYCLLPAATAAGLQRGYADKATATVASLQGPEGYLSLGSREVKSLAFWFPPQRPQQNLSFTFMTYADQLSVAICADETVLPHPEIILDAIQKQVDIYTEMLMYRRIPGEHRNHRIAANLAASGGGGGGGELIGSPSAQHLSSSFVSAVDGAVQESVSAADLAALTYRQQEHRKSTAQELHMRLAAVQLQLQEAASGNALPGAVSTERMDQLKLEFNLLMEELKRRRADSGDFDEDPAGEEVLLPGSTGPKVRRKNSRRASLAALTRRRSTSAATGHHVSVSGEMSGSRPHTATARFTRVDSSPSAMHYSLSAAPVNTNVQRERSLNLEDGDDNRGGVDLQVHVHSSGSGNTSDLTGRISPPVEQLSLHRGTFVRTTGLRSSAGGHTSSHHLFDEGEV